MPLIAVGALACPGASPGPDDAAVSPPTVGFGDLLHSDRFLMGEVPDPLFALGDHRYATPADPDGRVGPGGYRVAGPDGARMVTGGPAGIPLTDGFLVAHPRPGTWLERQGEDGAPRWSIGGDEAVTVVSSSATAEAAWFVVYAWGPLPERFGGDPSSTVDLQGALVRVRVDDGAVELALPLPGARAWGPVAALDDGGVAYLSPIAGERAIDGRTFGRIGVEQSLLEVFDAQGSPRWRRVLGPDARIDVVDLALGAGGDLLVAGRVAGSLDLGEGPVDSLTTRPFLASFDLQGGALRWGRQDLGGATSAVAVRDDGWIAWVRDLTPPFDLGGDVGLLSRRRDEDQPLGRALVAALVDGCGVARAARMWSFCGCFPDLASAYVVPYATAWSPEGTLWISAESDGAYRFLGEADGTLGTREGDVLGGDPGEVSWVVEVSGPAAPPDACTPPTPPPEPVVSVRVEGEGTVTVRRDDGLELGTCTGTCEVTARRHERLFLSAAPSPGHRFLAWDGACVGGEICALDHDADSAVTARFDETWVDLALPLSGEVSGARLAVTGGGHIWAAISSTDGLALGGVELAPPGADQAAVLHLDAAGALVGAASSPWSTPIAVVPQPEGGARVVRVERGNLRVTRYGEGADLLTDDVLPGVNTDLRWAEDAQGALFAVENESYARGRVLTLRDGVWTELAAFVGPPLLVQDAVARDDGLAITVSHGPQADLAGVRVAAAGTTLVVLAGDGAAQTVAPLPWGAPYGLLKPSEGSRWTGDLALIGLGDRFGGSGYHIEPIDAAGAFLGGGWGLPLLDPWALFPQHDAIRPAGSALWIAGSDNAFPNLDKLAVAQVGPAGEAWREVSRGPQADTWYASASDGGGTFVGLAVLGSESVFGGAPRGGPTLVRLRAPSAAP
jgi:hypothetical protein